MLNTLEKFCDGVNRFVSYAAVFFLLVTTSCCVLQVFTRYVLNNSLSWTEELARFTFIWSSMLGATVCTWKGTHVAVTVIKENLPSSIRKCVEVFIVSCMVAASYVLMAYGWTASQMSAFQRSPALKLSIRYTYLSACAAGTICFLYCTVILLKQFVRPAAQEK